MFTVIKWKKGNPYKYQMVCFYDKKLKCPRNRLVAYLGRATRQDVSRYYKGEKTYEPKGV